MSLSGAMNTALAGLRVSSRMAEVSSENVANALTEGFSKREVHINSDMINGQLSGVRISGITRATDVVATTSRREMSNEAAATATRANLSYQIASALGEPGQTGALANIYTEFGSALTAAANNPGTQTFLDNAVARSSDLARELNQLSDEAQRMRETADADIALEIDRLNTALIEIERLNTEIQYRSSTRSETNALQDVRQKHVDTVAELLPVRVIRRENDTIALYTKEGGKLVDGNRTIFGFDRNSMITHDMSLSAGSLSGLIVNGDQTDPSSIGGWYEGGRLGEMFAIRDTVVPEYSAQLDALARDVIERLQDPSVDTTLGAGDPGIFTDGGLGFDPANTLGLAQRISVNAAVDPSKGGQEWRLRDGMNAVAPGEAGFTAILQNLSDAFTEGRAGSPGMNVNGALGAAEFAAEITSQRGYDHAYREERHVYAVSQLSILREAESARTGVDTDEEMQRILQIEKAYAANAKVLNTIDDLLNKLLEI